MLKERKDSNLDNILYSHILLITTLPDSSPGLFICQVTHLSAKEYLLCNRSHISHILHITLPRCDHIIHISWPFALYAPNLSQDILD